MVFGSAHSSSNFDWQLHVVLGLFAQKPLANNGRASKMPIMLLADDQRVHQLIASYLATLLCALQGAKIKNAVTCVMRLAVIVAMHTMAVTIAPRYAPSAAVACRPADARQMLLYVET